MSLLALQRDFRAMLTDAPADMARWVAIDAQPGLAIYHNAYRVQLVECLRETFEKTLSWLGDDAFVDAARAHITGTPPHGWTLGDYGAGFDATLASLYPDDPEVAELAWLEWALSRAFEGEDATPVSTDALASVDWDRAALTLIPTLHIGAATTNAGAIWSALSTDTPDDATPPAAVLLPEPGAMLVWRQDFTPCFRTIEAAEEMALRLIAEGASFGTLCATLIEAQGAENGVAAAGAMLGQWLKDGLITAIAAAGL